MNKKLLSLILSLVLFVSQSIAQDRVITGRVVSGSEGTAITGVTVLVQGGLQGTQTDQSGNFRISTTTGSTLIFRAVGYEEQTVSVGAESTLNITLEESQEFLDEVIVVAYGTVKKSDFTGSATTITAKSLEKRPISNALVALQGAGPGVQTTTPSGGPGSSPSIRVRGVGSYSAGNAALVVVDGVEYRGGMANINPEDVESITVLKDAATIALYGSRGANGVVMVTTKTGAKGESKLNFKVQFGTNTNAMPSYNTVGPGEYYELMWEAYRNSLHFGDLNIPSDIAAQIASGKLPRNAAGEQLYNNNKYQDIVQYLGNYNAFNVPNTELVSTDGKLNPSAKLLYADDLDWLGQASKTGKRNEYNMNYSAGFKNTDLYASFNYLNEEGWGLRSTMDRYAARVNVNSKLKSWLKTGLNVNANHNTYDNASTGSSSIVNPFYFSRAIAPIYPVHVHDPATGEYVYDELGNKRYDIGNLSSEFGISRPYNSGRHAIAENLWNLDNSKRDFLGARAYVDFIINPYFTFTTSLSADITNANSEAYQNTIVGDGAPAGRYNQGWERRHGITFNQILNFNQSFGDHNVKALVGHESFDYRFNDVYGMRQGQGFDGFYTFTNFTDINSLTSGLAEAAMESYFTRANYDYKNKYYLSASVRYDGDSKLPELNRWSPFWSVGLAWRIEQEDFFHADWVQLLKLRASYGRLGNNDIGNYPYQPGYGIGNNNAAAPGSVLTELGSPDLKWEGQKPLDVGVDFSLLGGRISGAFDYYSRVSDGLLFSVRQPYHNGGTTDGSFAIDKNVGDMKNSGIELQVTGNVVRKEDFNWNLTFNLSTHKNEILKMPKETPEIVSSPYKRAEGKSIYEYFTRTFYGIDPDNGEVMYSGVTEYDAASAKIKIIDQGNGVMDTVTYDQNLARQDWIGKSALPTAYGSVSSSLSYKSIDLGFTFLYSMGGWANDSQYGSLMSPGPSNGANIHRDLFNGWRAPGDVTDIPRMDVNKTSQFGATSTRFLTKADYLSISNVNLSYTLPKEWLSRLDVSGARIFLSGENLHFFTKRKGMNTAGSFTGVASNSSYSAARTFTFGINLNL